MKGETIRLSLCVYLDVGLTDGVQDEDFGEVVDYSGV